MKKGLSLILVLCMILGTVIVSSVSVSAKNVDIGETGRNVELAETGAEHPHHAPKVSIRSKSNPNFYFSMLDNNTASVDGYCGSSKLKGKLTLPSKLDGYTVTEIDNNAFYQTGITQVVIPNTVKVIGRSAFKECVNLSAISVPASVTEICQEAFAGTRWYKNQKNGVVYAGKVALGYKGTCPSSITFKAGTTGIAARAFYDADNLKYVSIPDSVKTVGYDAFFSCDNLAAIRHSKNYTTIRENAFSLTKWLRDKYPYGYQGPVYIYKVLYDYVGYEPASLTIKSGTVSISDWALFNKELTSVSIPDSVTAIGACAFASCEQLKTVKMSKKVQTIGNQCFSDCKSLITISLPSTYKNVNFATFKNCTSLKSVYLPANLRWIGDDAFENCSKLSIIAIPAKVLQIGWEAFYGCTAMKSVIVPKSVGYIGWDAFGKFTTSSGKIGAKLAGFTIKGFTGSASQDYAKKNAFKFVSIGSLKVKLAAPVLSSAKKTSKGVKFTWKAVKYGKKYTVYRRTKNGKWKAIAKTSRTYYYDKKAKKRVRYYYTVRAVGYSYFVTSGFRSPGKTVVA